MIGKKNIVFGFIYLVFTASLGLVMVDKYGAYNEAAALKQQALGRLRLSDSSFSYEEEFQMWFYKKRFFRQNFKI